MRKSEAAFKNWQKRIDEKANVEVTLTIGGNKLTWSKLPTEDEMSRAYIALVLGLLRNNKLQTAHALRITAATIRNKLCR